MGETAINHFNDEEEAKQVLLDKLYDKYGIEFEVNGEERYLDNGPLWG